MQGLDESYAWQKLEDGSYYSTTGRLNVAYLAGPQGIAVLGKGRYDLPGLTPWVYSLSVRLVGRWCAAPAAEDDIADALTDFAHENAAQTAPFHLVSFRAGTCHVSYSLDKSGVASIWVKRISKDVVWPPQAEPPKPLP